MTRLSKKSGSGLVMWVLLLVGLVTLLLRSRSEKTISSLTQTQQLIKDLLTLKGYSDRMALWWVAISDHETGTWTSKLYKVASNMFGMKNPLTRSTLSQGPVDVNGKPNPNANPDDQYASFTSLANSVYDLDLYMKAKEYPKDFPSVEALISFMKKKGYFTAPEIVYLTSVKLRIP